ncbi:MAG: HEAT repeat domain-containing protein [Terriglobia bacterium]
MHCQEMENKLTLLLYDELSAEERTEIEAHLKACAGCRETEAELRRLQAVLNERPLREPTPELLVQCRWDLDEALDSEMTGWRGLLRSWLGCTPITLAKRAAAGLAILVAGFSLGWTLQQRAVPPASTTASGPQFSGADLSNLRIHNVSQAPADPQTGQPRFVVDVGQQRRLEGTLDDPGIQRVLVYVMKNYENPGIRRDTLEALLPRRQDPMVQEALLYVLRNDPNAGVRLAALEAVGELTWSGQIRQMLLESLETDANPGVRVAAIDVLLRHAGQEMVPRLERLAQEDENPYVRLKCAQAARELPREEF